MAAGLWLEERRALVGALHRLLQAQALPALDAPPALGSALAAFNAGLLGERAGGRSVLLGRLIDLLKASATHHVLCVQLEAVHADEGARCNGAGGGPGGGPGVAAGSGGGRAGAPDRPPQPGHARAHAAVRGARLGLQPIKPCPPCTRRLTARPAAQCLVYALRVQPRVLPGDAAALIDLLHSLALRTRGARRPAVHFLACPSYWPC